MSFEQRFLTVPGVIEVGDRRIKRYVINAVDRPIEPAILAAATEMLPRLLPREPDTTPRAAFAVFHRGRNTAAFVNLYSWVWDNVVEYHTAAAGEPHVGCPDRDPTHFVELTKPWLGCVWELAPFEHERAAWVRHMLVPDRPDLAAYLADTLPPGPVG
jgi:hypothetical protein